MWSLDEDDCEDCYGGWRYFARFFIRTAIVKGCRLHIPQMFAVSFLGPMSPFRGVFLRGRQSSLQQRELFRISTVFKTCHITSTTPTRSPSLKNQAHARANDQIPRWSSKKQQLHPAPASFHAVVAYARARLWPGSLQIIHRQLTNDCKPMHTGPAVVH